MLESWIWQDGSENSEKEPGNIGFQLRFNKRFFRATQVGDLMVKMIFKKKVAINHLLKIESILGKSGLDSESRKTILKRINEIKENFKKGNYSFAETVCDDVNKDIARLEKENPLSPRLQEQIDEIKIVLEFLENPVL
jgi:hypothetical protein